MGVTQASGGRRQRARIARLMRQKRQIGNGGKYRASA